VLFINIWVSAVWPIQPMHAHTLAGAAVVVIVLSIFLIIFCVYSVIFCIKMVELRTLASTDIVSGNVYSIIYVD